MSFAVFPMWDPAVIGVRGLIFYGYYALMPLVLLVEDRKWISKAPESIWNPEQAQLQEEVKAQ